MIGVRNSKQLSENLSTLASMRSVRAQEVDFAALVERRGQPLSQSSHFSPSVDIQVVVWADAAVSYHHELLHRNTPCAVPLERALGESGAQSKAFPKGIYDFNEGMSTSIQANRKGPARIAGPCEQHSVAAVLRR